MAGFDMAGMTGFPELLIIMVLVLFWIIPIAAAVWALYTLQRIRSGQEVIRLRLELLERTLQRSVGQ
jgi:hypothetical protein